MSYPVGLFNGITFRLIRMVSLKHAGYDLLMCFCMHIDVQYTNNLNPNS